MRALRGLGLVLVLGLALAAAQTRATKGLEIYVVDVEGGNATLFVAPNGESILIDNGAAYWIKVSAQQDGSFTVTNTRNRFSKTYKARN